MSKIVFNLRDFDLKVRDEDENESIYKHLDVVKRNLDIWAEEHGYINYKEYNRYISRITNREKVNKSKFRYNKYCSMYLGVYIAENVLSDIFENVRWMDFGNKGYDFVCDREYKIDVKSTCNEEHSWRFIIKKNKIADYFLMIAFDNRENLKPLHIWLIKGDECIEKYDYGEYVIYVKKLNEYNTFFINKRKLNKYIKYELVDKIGKVKECCNNLIKSNNML